MKQFIKKFKKHRVIQFLASIKITVACLLWLFVLTFWGTVAQVSDGLFQSQEKFFNSWYFLEFGFLPFPGGQLTLWILFVNLLANSIFRFVYRWSQIGILIIHLGLLSYFVAAFVTFHLVEESNITLKEGEGRNVSAAYHEWELSVWEAKGDDSSRVVSAFDLRNIKMGDVITMTEHPLEFSVRLYFPNAQAFVRREQPDEPILNSSGINDLARLAIETEPEKNFPGGIFSVRLPDGSQKNVLLFGKEVRPTTLRSGNNNYHLQIRRKNYALPILMTLNKFEMEKHPGTEVARSYRSYAQVEHQGVERDIEVYMNHPYRFKDYTFYQASYSIDQKGEYRSTLAVVKNGGRLLPYISSLITFMGLAVHFLMMAFRRRRA